MPTAREEKKPDPKVWVELTVPCYIDRIYYEKGTVVQLPKSKLSETMKPAAEPAIVKAKAAKEASGK